MNNALCRLIDIATEVIRGRGSKAEFKSQVKDRYDLDLDDDAVDFLFTKGKENLTNGDYPEETKLKALEKDLASFMHERTKQTASDWLSALYRTSLLSIVRTPQASLVGNAIALTSEAINRPLVVAIDLLASKATGQRSASLAGLSRMKAGVSRKAAQKTLQVLKQGYTDDEMRLGVTDDGIYMRQGLYGNNKFTKAIAWWVNFKFNAISAADRPAREAAFQSSLVEFATLQAVNEGLKGDAVKARVDELLGDDPDLAVLLAAALEEHDKDAAPIADIIFKSKLSADTILLQNRSQVTEAVGKLAALPGAFLILPFPRIPTNVTMRAMEHSPAGAFWGTYNLLRAKKAAKEGDMSEALALQRKGVFALGRSVKGSALVMIGFQLAAAGLISEPTELDSAQRGAQDAAGVQGSSIKIGDRWVRMGEYPQLVPLFWGASLYRSVSVDEIDGVKRTGTDNATAVIGAVGKTALDTPVMTGVRDLTADITALGERDEEGNPKPIKTFNNLAGAIIPADVTDAIRLVKGEYGYSPAPNVAERIRSDFAMVDAPTRDALGREKVVNSLMFRGVSSDKGEQMSDPVAQEIYRLGVGLSVPYRNKARGENQVQYSQRLEMTGSALRDLLKPVIEDERYTALNDSERKDVLKKLLSKYRGQLTKAVTARILGEEE